MQNNLEINILNQLGWNDEQKFYLGSLIFDITDRDDNDLLTIVSERQADILKITAIYPNIDAPQPTSYSLYINKTNNSIDFSKTTELVTTEAEAIKFIDNLKNLINNNTTSGVFYPINKISSSSLKPN